LRLAYTPSCSRFPKQLLHEPYHPVNQLSVA
jgi:hypothetical protein